MKPYTGVKLGKICWRCGKPITQYYNILCMDCADEIGISEIFLNKVDEKDRKWYVRRKVIEDLEKAVRIQDGKIVVLWLPMFITFPNITLNMIFKIMGVNEKDEKKLD